MCYCAEDLYASKSHGKKRGNNYQSVYAKAMPLSKLLLTAHYKYMGKIMILRYKNVNTALLLIN